MVIKKIIFRSYLFSVSVYSAAFYLKLSLK